MNLIVILAWGQLCRFEVFQMGEGFTNSYILLLLPVNREITKIIIMSVAVLITWNIH